MSDIGKGDWVQFVNGTGYEGPEREGGVYYVENIGPSLAKGFGHVMCVFTQAPGSDFGHPFRVYGGADMRRFRPLGGNARSETREAPAELETA